MGLIGPPRSDTNTWASLEFSRRSLRRARISSPRIGWTLGVPRLALRTLGEIAALDCEVFGVWCVAIGYLICHKKTFSCKDNWKDNSPPPGRGAADRMSPVLIIKVLYCFHRNNDDSKCDVAHTSLPVSRSKVPYPNFARAGELR